MRKTLGTLTCAAALALVAMPAAVIALPYQDIVRDARGNPVTDARGNCVLTKWEANGNQCGIDQEARTVYFEFGSAKLTGDARRRLDTLISTLKTQPVDSVDIVGYADPIGDKKANERLSRRRAEAVRNYLSTKGGLRVNDVRLQGLGETSSVSQCNAQKLKRSELIKCLWRDRRVEVVLNIAN